MATSKLQEYTSKILHQYFIEYTIKENHRPEWMISGKGKRLELDFFIDKLDVAIEVQGQQHYIFVEFFHGNEKIFKERLEDDKEKKILCKKKKVRLFEISTEEDVIDLVKKIKRELRENNKKYEPSSKEEWKATEIISNKSNSYQSRIGSAVHFMYWSFLETGELYPTNNNIIKNFYKKNRNFIDKALNERFKNPKTETRLDSLEEKARKELEIEKIAGLRTLTKSAHSKTIARS